MKTLKKVTSDEVYDVIYNYVNTTNAGVSEYEDMVNVVVSMIKNGYCFTMERDTLRDAMECLTYMISPDNDMNKDRVICQLIDDDDDDDDESDDEGMNNPMMNMFAHMMNSELKGGEETMNDPTPEEILPSDERCPEGECKLGNCDEGECKLGNCDEESVNVD